MLKTPLKNIAMLIVCSSVLLTMSACKSTHLTQQPASVAHHEFLNSGDSLPINTITNVDGIEVNLQKTGI